MSGIMAGAGGSGVVWGGDSTSPVPEQNCSARSLLNSVCV